MHSLSNPCKIKTEINHFANQPFYILIIDRVQVVYTIYSAYWSQVFKENTKNIELVCKM